MSQPKCVAKVSDEVRLKLGVEKFYDDNGDLVVNLDFGDVLEIYEFEAVAYVPTAQNLADGIIPPKRHS